MIENTIKQALTNLHLGGLLFFQKINSTNDEAKLWALNDAPDLSLVYADQQTHGRGRGSRSWITRPGSALAFSLILHTGAGEEKHLQKFTALGALAVCDAVNSLGLPAKIKWPNDVLLNGRKFCGILAETSWMDATPLHVILGIGVNVGSASVPTTEVLNFPATSLESESGKNFDRLSLLHQIVQNIISWRTQIGGDGFMTAWEKNLAFMGEQVVLRDGSEGDKVGWVEGLAQDGSLKLRAPDGEHFSVQWGEIHLHPLV
jgi:BirA family biotin operon repressor/biotin-[acetyl-CoA-carboxylase] ligase